MQQRRHSKHQANRLFTASEVAEYEYCPRVWWYEQYEPLVNAGDDELFANLVKWEHAYGAQATAIPEYQVTEQLLVRRGAFEEGRQQHAEHAEEVAALAEIAEERSGMPSLYHKARLLMLITLSLIGLALLFIAAGLWLAH